MPSPVSGKNAPALLVLGANVVTMDPERRHADALAVRDGLIVHVGNEADARAAAGPDARVIDARDATVLPGLIDCHGHLLSYGESLRRLDLHNTPGFGALVQRVAAQAATIPAGTWISGRGWDSSVWGGDGAIDIEALSHAVPGHPVFLNRHDGHAAIVNRAALAATGVDAATPDPVGGALARRNGQLTGLLVENAARLVSSHIPKPSAKERGELIALAGQRCLALGLTGVFDAIDAPEWLQDIRALLDDGTALPRVYGLLRAQENPDPISLARQLFVQEHGGHLSMRRLRMILDGGMGARGARMHAPYLDDEGTRGFLMLDPARVAAASRAALDGGWSMCVHAIGDEAIDLLLDTWEPLLSGLAPGEHRFMIEHCVIPSDTALERIARLGLIASVQPLHAVNVARWIETRLGRERARHAYAFRRLADAGVPLAMGSDFPVASPDPLLGLRAGVTRSYTGADGIQAVTLPGQCLTMMQMLAGYTRTAAWTAFAENEVGMLRAGMKADISIFEGDLLAADPQTLGTKLPGAPTVRFTVLDGSLAYEA